MTCKFESGERKLLVLNQLPENVDAVLVDAPCSSTGTWRRGPDRKWTVREEDLVDFARLQLELLHTGWNSLRAGGRLVYATCSLLEDENEAVIKQFEKEASGVTHSHQESLLPHRHNTDGFFISVFKK